MKWDYLVGDVRNVLASLDAQSVQCIVTSPPYYLQRDYKIPDSKWADGWIGQLGWEPTPDMFVDHLMESFGEAMRVLKDTGILFLNIGDKYAKKRYDPWGVKPGDEYGMPEAVVRAMMKAGWYRRATIIWHKTSSRPEGHECRPHKAHEPIYMLTKKASGYYYDAEAVRQPHSEGTVNRWKSPNIVHIGSKAYGSEDHQDATGEVASGNMGKNGKPRQMDPRGAHLRTVWSFPNVMYRGEHLAPFPERLAEICILAGTSLKACPTCGAPWARVMEEGEPDEEWKRRCGADTRGEYHGKSKKDHSGSNSISGSELKAQILSRMKHKKTVGWEATCKCSENDGSGQCTVLDPFAGSGTTLKVARKLGRSAIGIDISKKYQELANERAMLKVSDIESYA